MEPAYQVQQLQRKKTEVENRGFTLEVVLDLSKDFSGRENTREKLAEALNRHGSLTKYLDDDLINFPLKTNKKRRA